VVPPGAEQDRKLNNTGAPAPNTEVVVARTRLTLNIDAIDRRAHEGAVKGITMSGEYVLTESRAVVPLDEANLERSGRVDVDGAALEAAVSYGGDDDQLGIVAIVQHERLDYQHAPGRTAKYLEAPLLAAGDVVLAIQAAQIRRALK
jgi:hypothetical protein